MEDLNKLEEIGLLKISEKTHIGIDQLRHIIDKDFEKLGRVKALGFVKILERECKIDFTKWREEYKDFIANEVKNDDGVHFVVVREEKGGSKRIFYFILFLLIIISFYFFFVKNQNSEPIFPPIEENSMVKKVYETIFANSAVKNKIDEVAQIGASSSSILSSSLSVSSSSSDFAHSEAVYKKFNSNSGKEVENIQNIATDSQENYSPNGQAENRETQNIGLIGQKSSIADINNTSAQINGSKKLDETNNLNQTQVNLDEVKVADVGAKTKATILAKSKIWIGIVDLQGQTKKSGTYQDIFEIDLTKKLLVATGHGEFTLTGENINKKYTSKDPVRFLIQDGNISEIDKVTFEQLNQGRKW